MSDVLGVDGGQSGTRVGHSRLDRVVELEGISRQRSGIIDVTATTIASGWRQLDSPAVERAVLGLTTAPAGAQDADRLCALVAAATQAREVWVVDDSVTNHAGALYGRPGVSLTVGTGVACMAVSAAGVARTFGGHGYLLGDEGGAFWLGRQALAAVLRHLEGRGPATSLQQAAQAHFGGLHDLHVRLHDAERPVDAIARFAPLVIDAAATDEVAAGIVEEAARELADVARAAAIHVGAQAVPVALGGRLISDDTALRRRLLDLIASVPGIATVAPAGTALDGALWLGEPEHLEPYANLVHRWQAA